MVKVTIRLVGEEKDRLFERIELDPQIHVDDLVKEIERLTNIPHDYQQIQFRGDRLPGSLHPLESIKDFEELVVMHSDLPWWEQYKKSADIALRPGPERQDNANEAVRIHKRLMENGFFMVYCGFTSFRMENHHKIASWTDGSIQLMREATENHFLRQHFKRGAEDETDFTCRFEARPVDLGGSRKNTLAYVQLHGQEEETKFNIKCHHFGSNSSARGRSPDITELYCYKLLELIHVGPQAQFILPNRLAGTITSLYIATRWDDNFIPLSGNTEEDVGVDVLMQILLLGTFLFIGDLHSDNCGYWKDTKEVAIVDFMPRNSFSFSITHVKQTFFDNVSSVYWKSSHVAALEDCDEATRMEVARKCLKKWDLLSKIDLANEQITPEKNRMKRMKKEIGLKGFNYSATEELDQYISTIKQNIIKLSEFLKASE